HQDDTLQGPWTIWHRDEAAGERDSRGMSKEIGAVAGNLGAQSRVVRFEAAIADRPETADSLVHGQCGFAQSGGADRVAVGAVVFGRIPEEAWVSSCSRAAMAKEYERRQKAKDAYVLSP